MILVLLLLHAFCAMFLVGAITHQVLAVWWPITETTTGWWRSLRAVHPERYTKAVVALYCITVVPGALDYVPFRLVARAQYLDLYVKWATGLFELKEHATGIGLAVLPAYVAAWREPGATGARRAFTTFVTIVIWWNLIVGHVVNNVRGM